MTAVSVRVSFHGCDSNLLACNHCCDFPTSWSAGGILCSAKGSVRLCTHIPGTARGRCNTGWLLLACQVMKEFLDSRTSHVGGLPKPG